MSSIFGPMQQCGYVVTNLDEAIQHWVNVLGIGPFLKASHLKLDFYLYKECAGAPDLSIALASSGNLQIELIEQHNDAPSSYRDFLQAHGPGLQLFCTWANDYDADRARFDSLGYKVNFEGKILGGGRFIYYETEGYPGTIVEFGEAGPSSRRLFGDIKRSASNWDGTDPVWVLGL